ncbi:hypothetical protein K2Y11_06700 [bacterium]|nr:hypothetical protein [bacterium]
MMTTQLGRLMDHRSLPATEARWRLVRWCDQIVVLAVIVLTLALFCTGCAVTESVLARKMPMTPSTSGRAVEMAVVSEPRVVAQDGQQISGLIVQVVLLDANGMSTEADGGIVFSIYADNTSRDQKLEPDHQWKFNNDEFKQAVTHSDTLGTVHNFWLPLKGKLASAKKLQLLSLHTTGSGMQLSQWNQIQLKSPPTMKIEQYTEGDKTEGDESESESHPAEEVVPVEEASVSRVPLKK